MENKCFTIKLSIHLQGLRKHCFVLYLLSLHPRNKLTSASFDGEKNGKGEPLKTLRSFRSTLDKDEKKVYGTSPFFGVNLGVEQMGSIGINDKIYIKKNA